MVDLTGMEAVNPYTGESPAGALRQVAGQQAEPKISSKEQFDDLPVGTMFIDPEGQKRQKPYRPLSAEDLNAIPDGSHWIDPEGGTHQKPNYQGIDFTAQTLFDMAHSDKGKRMALERSYPGKVKDDPAGGFVIEDEGGVLRKPGRGTAGGAGFLTAQVAPTVGAGIGGLLGGAVGTIAEPGGGSVVGGAGGAYGGGYMGERVNQIVASLAGVHDPEGAESAARTSGYVSAAGETGGRALHALGPSIAAGAGSAASKASQFANKVLRTDPEALRTALGMAERGEQAGAGPFGISLPGTATPPSQVFKESPHLANIAEVMEPALHMQKPLRQSAEAHYERGVGEILGEVGVQKTDSAVKPTAAVSTEAAGRAILDTAREKSAAADARLNQLLEERRAGATGRAEEVRGAHEARVGELQRAAEESRRAAQGVIDQGFADIDRTAQDAMRVAQAGHNSGDLWRQVGQQLWAFRQGIQARATRMYTAAEHAGADVHPNVDDLAQRAQQFLDEMPEGFEQQRPAVVRRLRDLAGEMGEDGNWVREPAQPTWAQLHALRTDLRQNIKWNDLTSDVRNGTYKFFNNRVNEILHDIEATPEAEGASTLLRAADQFYRENMGPLENRQVQAVMDSLDSGLQADPKVLLQTILKDGRTEVAEHMRGIVGPAQWNALRATDVQEMLTRSRDLNGQIDGRKFAREVLDRQNQGLLNVLHGDQASETLVRQAQRIEQLAGRLDIQARPGDTVNDLISRALAAERAATEAGRQNPLGTLKTEMQQIMREHGAALRQARKNDPLSFLLNPTVGAHGAVEKILADPDMIVAASRAFKGGENSKEFQLLRQVWVQRFLQEGMQPSKGLAQHSEEIQRLMFPGVTLDNMRTLAKEMDLLMGAKNASGETGKSMMATSMVEHPVGHVTGLGKLAGPVKLIPGGNAAARAVLGAYYQLVRELSTSPSTLRWLEKGLGSRDPAEKAAARRAISAALQKAGLKGNIGTQGLYRYENLNE